ncbi:uncharacterized protein H6S33_007050 [Morchella sextelata]|uniref:uncharacterized protein n=1 Tax=Morchella sextelata TaxID=1174677 RepID=UPI001D04D48E|nr:uncharacterized protein H6S33_007050 [Morchella sextelata]KAH0604019.1 hypothetical protein H6S33_007050 [Morchella sextelata]
MLNNITGNRCPRYWDLHRRFTEEEAGAEEELKASGIKQARGVLWNTPFIDPMQLPKPDILHVLYLGLFKHMMDWLMAFLKKHKRKDEFDTIWARIPSYLYFNAMNKPYSQVSQWQGKEMHNLVKILLPTLVVSLRRPTAKQRPVFNNSIRCLNQEARIVGSQLWREVQDTIANEEEPSTAKKRRLEDAELLAIDSQVLEFTGDRSDFNFPKMQMFSTELGEPSHKAMKVGHKRLNKVDASEQILTHIVTAESFAMAELNQLEEQKKDTICRPADDLRHLGSLMRRDIANTAMNIA